MSNEPENSPENTAALEGAIGEIAHGPSAFEQFLDNNQKMLIIGGLILILGVVAYVVVDGLKKNAEKEAAAVVSAATTIPELKSASEEHSGTNAAGTALYKIAMQQWSDQRQDDAIATMEKFVGEYPAHPLVPNAKAAVGSYNLQLGNLDKAKSSFQEVVDLGLGHELYGTSLLNLGDIAMREGDDDGAKALFEQLVNDLEARPGGAMVREMAQKRLEIVGVTPPTAEKVEAPVAPKPATPALPAEPVPAIPAVPVPAVPSTPETPQSTDKTSEVVPAPVIPAIPVPAEATEVVEAAKASVTEVVEEVKDAVEGTKNAAEGVKEAVEKAVESE